MLCWIHRLPSKPVVCRWTPVTTGEVDWSTTGGTEHCEVCVEALHWIRYRALWEGRWLHKEPGFWDVEGQTAPDEWGAERNPGGALEGATGSAGAFHPRAEGKDEPLHQRAEGLLWILCHRQLNIWRLCPNELHFYSKISDVGGPHNLLKLA